MNPNKSPGIDGFPAICFQKAWPHVNSSLLHLIIEAFIKGKVDPDFNRTLIVLIPNTEGKAGKGISQCSPISLCTVPLKIITKLLLDRLRPLLDRLLSKTQSSFVPGRHTTDNIIIVQEALPYNAENEE